MVMHWPILDSLITACAPRLNKSQDRTCTPGPMTQTLPSMTAFSAFLRCPSLILDEAIRPRSSSSDRARISRSSIPDERQHSTNWLSFNRSRHGIPESVSFSWLAQAVRASCTGRSMSRNASTTAPNALPTLSPFTDLGPLDRSTAMQSGATITESARTNAILARGLSMCRRAALNAASASTRMWVAMETGSSVDSQSRILAVSCVLLVSFVSSDMDL